MVAGTWAAKRVIERLSAKVFERWVTILLVIVAVQMIVSG